MPAGYRSLSTLSKPQSRVLEQLLGSLGGTPPNIQQSPLFQSGSSYLSSLLSGNPEATAAFEAPYLRQFNEQIVPGLAERFAGMGAGAQSSSAFNQALGAAGAGLQENLASLREGLRFQAVPQALGFAQQPVANYQGLAGLGLGTQARGYVPRQKPFWQELLLGLGGGLSQLGGSYGLRALGV